jgi:hypothetical protein
LTILTKNAIIEVMSHDFDPTTPAPETTPTPEVTFDPDTGQILFPSYTDRTSDEGRAIEYQVYLTTITTMVANPDPSHRAVILRASDGHGKRSGAIEMAALEGPQGDRISTSGYKAPTTLLIEMAKVSPDIGGAIRAYSLSESEEYGQLVRSTNDGTNGGPEKAIASARRNIVRVILEKVSEIPEAAESLKDWVLKRLDDEGSEYAPTARLAQHMETEARSIILSEKKPPSHQTIDELGKLIQWLDGLRYGLEDQETGEPIGPKLLAEDTNQVSVLLLSRITTPPTVCRDVPASPQWQTSGRQKSKRARLVSRYSQAPNTYASG